MMPKGSHRLVGDAQDPRTIDIKTCGIYVCQLFAIFFKQYNHKNNTRCHGGAPMVAPPRSANAKTTCRHRAADAAWRRQVHVKLRAAVLRDSRTGGARFPSGHAIAPAGVVAVAGKRSTPRAGGRPDSSAARGGSDHFGRARAHDLVRRAVPSFERDRRQAIGLSGGSLVGERQVETHPARVVLAKCATPRARHARRSRGRFRRDCAADGRINADIDDRRWSESITRGCQ
jgi:hypothetical protein